MYSVPAGSFERICSLLSLWRAWRRCSAGRLRTPAVAAFAVDADRHLCRLREDLLAGRWRPGPWRLRLICDPKRRVIAAQPVPDRMVHQALVTELQPHFDRSFIDHSFACSTGRGPHRALLLAFTWNRRYAFRLQLDIRRYFPSMRHDTLRQILFHRLRDERTRALVDQVLAASHGYYRHRLTRAVLGRPAEAGRGLPVGTFFSQWAGALYLDGLDHFIKRHLKIGPYQRFMDDLLLFSDDREALAAARADIERWLWEERGLQFNPKVGQIDPTRRPFTWLGARMDLQGVHATAESRRRMRIKLVSAAKRGPEPLERTVAAYRGQLWFRPSVALSPVSLLSPG